MKMFRFSVAKPNVCLLILICIFGSFPLKSAVILNYSIQILATKTPVNIQEFAKSYHITDSIFENITDGWYKYSIGNFETYVQAENFAKNLVENSKLTKVIIQKIPDGAELKKQVNSLDAIIVDNQEVAIQETNDTMLQDSINESENIPEEVESYKDMGHFKGTLNYWIPWIISNDKAVQLKDKLINKGKNKLPVKFHDFYVKLIDNIYRFPIILIFFIFIFFFILNLIFVLLVINYSNQKKNRKERYNSIYKNMYEEVLLSYLFGEKNWEQVLVKLKKRSKPLNKLILSEILLNLHENLKGGMEKQLSEIYIKLGLNLEAEKAGKSWSKFKKIQGIHELTYLDSKIAMKIVPDLLNHPDDIIRAEAQIAYVQINPDNPFELLRRLNTPFTRWTQLSAFYLFRLQQLPIPSFIEYLDLDHFNVRNFSLRMINYFQQLENVEEIFKMLESKMELTRFLTYKTINDLRIYDGKELIKNKYNGETEKNKLEIIKALRNIGNSEDFDFLEQIIRSGTITLKTETCRSLYFMSPEGKEKMLELKGVPELELEIYIDHITDSRN